MILPGDLPELPAQPFGRSRYRWRRRLGGAVFVLLCFELGVFLIVFPWLSGWEQNYFSTLGPVWRRWWSSPYFRGAVSGLGAINLYLAGAELLRLLKDVTGRADTPGREPVPK